ncbi:perforin-1-like [Xiphophorus hellerii]|uniref:perforin-1-like n=1 Tax=Xiphophorus hellerii TaxID=8084 RepID=UPI0013B3AD3C|nr:perforin-1-like [Xiphophorus hellerii]
MQHFNNAALLLTLSAEVMYAALRNMLLLHVCISAGVLLCLPQCTTGVCTDGTPKQCQEADTAPGTNLAGEGFDITTMERKGAFVLNMDAWRRKDKKCTLCVNPFMENKKQKLPLSVLDWRAMQSCNSQVSSKLHKSSESLVSSTSSSVENNWKVSLDFQAIKSSASLMLAGTNSKVADYSMEKTKNDKFSFSSLSMSCEYYSYRVSNSPRLHREFSKAVKQLPRVYSSESKEQFYKLIDTYGTHYISKVKLGGDVQSVTSIRQCQASLENLSAEEVQMCLMVEASASFRVTVKAESKHCKKDVEKSQSKTAFSSLFSDRFTEIKGGHTTEPDLLFSADKDPSAYKKWLDSIPQNPDIISYSLGALHELLPPKSPTWSNLRSAISHYILEKGLVVNCTERCRKDSRDQCVCQCQNDEAVNQDCCPKKRGMARLIVTAQRATGLWGDYFTSTDGFVKIFYNKKEHRSQVINNNNNPNWNMVVDLGSQDLSVENKVRFEVWDQDHGWDDDLLGSCEPLLQNGIKVDVCNMNHGRLYFKLEVKCAPSLTGALCTEYQPTPMNQSLKKLYVSRHALPIPKAMLLEMGVFLNESVSAKLTFRKNQSLTAKRQTYYLK